MYTKNQKKITAILHVLQDINKPVGGTIISKSIQRYGFTLSQRTIRWYLVLTDKAGLTKKIGKRGRIITPAGKEELSKSFAFEKVGLVASKIDELSYKMDFSHQNFKGNIILNISVVSAKNIHETINHMLPIFKKDLGMGKFLVLGKSSTEMSNISIQKNQVAIGTICSVTINGIFLNAGIPINSRFGGLLEIRNGKPTRFTQIINYNGTTLDPLEIFIKGKMTSVAKTARTGNGIIGASFREIPAVALPEANKLKKKLDKIGLNGILLIGNPGQPLLDIPVPEGKAGMIVMGGLNPIAAAEETGIEIHNIAMGTLFPFKELVEFSSIVKPGYLY